MKNRVNCSIIWIFKQAAIIFSCICMFYSLSGTLIAQTTDGTASKERAQALHDTLAQAGVFGKDHLGYLEFANSHFENKYGIKPFPILRNERSRLKREDVDAFSIFSGGLAIRESLQLDSFKSVKEAENTVMLDTLAGPETASHPFKEMLNGRTVKVPELAKYAPYDFYYLHVEDSQNALLLLEHIAEKTESLFDRFMPVTVNFQMTEKILAQLAIRIDPSNRKYYGYIIDQMAVVGSDPFLINGSDITMIYKLKKPDVFAKTIKEYRDYFKKEYGAKETGLNINGIPCSLISTSDRSIHSYTMNLDNETVIISNSLNAVKIITETYLKKRPSLADQDEYRYMRSVYPYDSEKEDVFLYLSDPFIRRLNGPATRIKESRRVVESQRMSALELYTTLYFQMYKKRASSIDDLKKEFSAEELAMFGGLELDNNSLAVKSRTFGQRGLMLPNIDYSVDKVSENESQGYAKFLSEYNDYWREYFDPIGIRAKNGDKIKIETCILPLIENSIYRSVAAISGGEPIVLTSSEKALPSEVLSASFKIDRKLLEKSVSRRPRVKSSDVSLEDLFNDEIQIHMMDALPLVDFNSAELIRWQLTERSHKNEALIGVLVWSLFHPVRIAIPLKKAEYEERCLDIISDTFNSEIDKLLGSKSVQLYNQIQDKSKFKVILISVYDIVKFRIYLGVKDGVLHITSTQDHLMQVLNGGLQKGWVDRFLDHFRKKEEIRGNAIGVYRPNRLKAEKNQVVAGAMESARDASFRNLSTYMLFNQLFGPAIDKESLQSYGFRLQCPAGGKYGLNEKGQPYSSFFGTPFNSELDMDGDSVRKINQYLNLKGIQVNFELTKEGFKSVIEIE